MIMSFIFRQHTDSMITHSKKQKPGKLSRFYAILTLLLPLAVFLVSCGSNAASSPYQINFAVDGEPNANDSGVYVALAQGWYKQQGITVNILPFSTSVSSDQLVSSGKADFGISFAPALTGDRARNQPVVSVAAVYQHNTGSLVSLKTSGLDTVAKLAGKRYANGGSAWEQPLVTQILSCNGASDGSFQNVVTDLDPLVALQSGNFDFAIMGQGWGVIAAKFQGIGLNVFPFVDYCIPDAYQTDILSNESFLQNHPDIARRFLAATSQGYTYAAQHPQQATNILVAGAPKGTFPDLNEILASQQFQSAQYINDGKCWGYQTLQRWTGFPQFMYNHHAILDATGKPITKAPDYAAAYTNDYLPSCS